MSDEMPVIHRRGTVRTAALILISICVPTLGVILGGIELGYGSYRFGSLLIVLTLVSSFAIVMLLMSEGG